jgi:Arc/MetJ-type ribon-helix-helix transcriptional regulator
LATLTLKVPDQLRDQAQDLADEMGYQSVSEYVRTAMREKIEGDLVKVRLQDDEEKVTLEEARQMVKKDSEVNHQKSRNKEGSQESKREAKARNP